MLVRVLESRHFHIDDGWVTYLSITVKIINAHPHWPRNSNSKNLSSRYILYICKMTCTKVFVTAFVIFWKLISAQISINRRLIKLEMTLFFVFSSVQFSRSVVSDSLRPHESQHTRPSCSSPSPGVHSDSRPSSQWCHPAISSSVIPFSSCPQSLLASESFPMSHLFSWGGQNTGVSTLASVLPKKSQG